MSLLQQALVAFGDRESMSSGELLWRLDPNYLQTYTTKQRAGFHLSKALGVSPHRFFDPQRERWRSEYHRVDLEAVQRKEQPELKMVTAEPMASPAPPATAAEHGSDEWLAARGIARCRHCGLNTPDGDLCLRCEKPL
jgi:hypothetical protein